MKEKALTAKTNTGAKLDTLYAKLTAAENNVEKAWASYEEKEAAYEKAAKHHADKHALLGLLIAAKIARFTYKIKKAEQKLAKANWKDASKAQKKSAPPASVDSVKQKPKKANHSAPKDTATKGKSSKSKTSPTKVAKKEKKVVASA